MQKIWERRSSSTSPSQRVLTVCAAIVLSSLPMAAQGGKASLSGTVTDSTGATVPGVAVTVTNVSTGVTLAATTNEAGVYTLPFLNPGTYVISAKREGFKAETREGISLTVDQQASVNITLTVGAVSEEVRVSANAELINTTSAALGQVISERAILELPLNGRNPAALVLLTPGAVDVLQTGAGVHQSYTTFPTQSGASVNGNRQGGTFYLLDGVFNMDNYHLLAAPFPNADATQEFRVVGNNFEAQYGFAAGAVVSVVTKSGSNTWHGDVFEFLRNEKLNAREFFGGTRDRLKRNQFGASAGGKIIQDKLFIFGNYQGTTERLQGNARNAFTPTQSMVERGDFSGLLPRFQLRDPVTGNPFPNNQIPVSRFNPTVLRILESIPRGSEPDGFVSLPGFTQIRDFHEWTSKVDFFHSQKHNISGRTYWNNFAQPGQSGGGNLLNSDRTWDARFENYSANYTWTVSPTLVNNLVGSYGRLRSVSETGLRDRNGEPICYSRLIKVAEPETSPCSIESFGAVGFGFGQNYNAIERDTWTVSNTLTKSLGRHLIVAGVDIMRQSWDLATDWQALPIISFDGSVTGHDFSDVLLGRPSSFWQGGGQYQRIAAVQQGYYVQDQIKVKPNLMVNIGIRWEPYRPPKPASGRIGAFRPGQQSQRYPNAPVGLVFPGDPGVPEGGVEGSLNYWNPRLGIAWQPGFLPRTSIRTAVGVFTSPIDYSTFNPTADTQPFSPVFSYRWTEVPGGIDFSDPWANYAPTGGTSPFPPFPTPNEAPPSSATFTTPVLFAGGFNPDFKLARTYSWNLSVEHQLVSNFVLRAAYVGSQASHLQLVVQRNPGIFANGGRRTLFPEFQSVIENASWATASYHSGQFTLEKRFSQGLQFTANYTWSKTIDTWSRGSQAFSGGGIANPFDLNAQRGLSDLHVGHVWVANWVYESPGLANLPGMVRHTLGGWQLSGIWRVQSGRPFSIAGGFGNNNSGSLVGGDRADYNGQPLNVKEGEKQDWILRYFNTAAFTANAPGTFGNSGRNILMSPHFNTWDLGISKNWRFQERYRLQFRWEMFNALNTPSFGVPNTTPSSQAFGRIAGRGPIPARLMQAALKFYW
ncbi:MAG: carboxypeptidase regulatory-like domain-containing protein [Bryobacterales bacterium]|nr:carboxypeptidase regulatory-like domain-containing protein [Bryobacterales bacterium]MEB2362488.1 carboxypeptidase regulatory-like domain-containing protein [Bryobacterales bacterium]